jgi:hypothetical protein
MSRHLPPGGHTSSHLEHRYQKSGLLHHCEDGGDKMWVRACEFGSGFAECEGTGNGCDMAKHPTYIGHHSGLDSLPHQAFQRMSSHRRGFLHKLGPQGIVPRQDCTNYCRRHQMQGIFLSMNVDSLTNLHCLSTHDPTAAVSDAEKAGSTGNSMAPPDRRAAAAMDATTLFALL